MTAECYGARMPSLAAHLTARRAASALAGVLLLVSCVVPTTTGSSSSSSGGGSSSSGDGGSDADPGVSAARAALCSAYANNAASCCTQMPGSCPSDTAPFWNDSCLKFARSCAAMPTCFSGTDCNTIIYCTASTC